MNTRRQREFKTTQGQYSPVMLIFADHLEVPSSTLCLICFMWVPCVALSRANTSCISSKISGLFLSLIFMRSFNTMMMFCVRSSAPCLELFSAAPRDEKRKSPKYFHHSLKSLFCEKKKINKAGNVCCFLVEKN